MSLEQEAAVLRTQENSRMRALEQEVAVLRTENERMRVRIHSNIGLKDERHGKQILPNARRLGNTAVPPGSSVEEYWQGEAVRMLQIVENDLKPLAIQAGKNYIRVDDEFVDAWFPLNVVLNTSHANCEAGNRILNAIYKQAKASGYEERGIRGCWFGFSDLLF